jgi:hypothetical protein
MNTTQINQNDIMELLCEFFTGRSIEEFPIEQRSEVQEKIIQEVYQFVINYMEENNEISDVIRIKQSLRTKDTSLLEKFPSTSKAFQKSLLMMLETLS